MVPNAMGRDLREFHVHAAPEMPMAKPAGGGNLTPSSDLCDRTDPPKSPSS